MMHDDTFDFGRILRPHGTGGDVRVVPLCDDLDHFRELMDTGRVLVRSDPERRAPKAQRASSNAVAGPMLPPPAGPQPPGAKPRPIHPISCRDHSGFALVHFRNYDDLPAADMLRGAILCLRESDLPEPEEDEFYWHELEGLEVRDRELGILGKVERVEDNPAHVMLVVRPAAPEPPFRIPFVDAFVGTVDLESGTIDVDLPPGFVEAQK